MIFLAWIGSIISIIANFLAAKKFKIAPILWLIGTGLLLFTSITKQDWSNVFLFAIYEVLNIYMAIEWNKKQKRVLK
jgi:membrane protein implicated in regulation of membrane protease activity